MWNQHPVHKWSDATGGEHLERLFWQEVKAGNWNELERHLAATFVCVTPAGRFDRAAAVEQWKQLQVSDYLLSDLEVAPNGNDMVVTYTISLRGTRAGRPLPEVALRGVTVWQRTSHGWTVITHSETVPQS
jgi:hypothetical protein